MKKIILLLLCLIQIGFLTGCEKIDRELNRGIVVDVYDDMLQIPKNSQNCDEFAANLRAFLCENEEKLIRRSVAIWPTKEDEGSEFYKPISGKSVAWVMDEYYGKCVNNVEIIRLRAEIMNMYSMITFRATTKHRQVDPKSEKAFEYVVEVINKMNEIVALSDDNCDQMAETLNAYLTDDCLKKLYESIHQIPNFVTSADYAQPYNTLLKIVLNRSNYQMCANTHRTTSTVMRRYLGVANAAIMGKEFPALEPVSFEPAQKIPVAESKVAEPNGDSEGSDKNIKAPADKNIENSGVKNSGETKPGSSGRSLGGGHKNEKIDKNKTGRPADLTVELPF